MESKTILLVEDNADDVILTTRALKNNHVMNDIVVARDGKEALDYLFCTGSHTGRDPAVMPVIVMLDIKLPKISGLEVLKQIRDNDRTRLLPVVVLTSSDEEKDLFESYRLGANSFVRKPVEFPEFLKAIKRLALYWLILNSPPPNTVKRS